MKDLGDRAEDSVIYFAWSTNDSDGAAITRGGDGTVSVYKDDGIAQSVAGITDTEDFDGVTGVHLCKIDTSADAFYAAGCDYCVVLAGATIDGQTVNAVLAVFSIENRRMRGTDSAALASVCTEARLAELAAANLPADIDSLLARLTAARGGYLDSLNGHTAQTGDSFARLGAPAGASVSADILAAKGVADDIETDTQDIQSRLPAALVSGRMTANVAAINDVVAAAVRLALSAGQIIPGTVDDAVAPSTTVFEADDITEATADHYNGRIVIFTSGNLAGQATDITDYALNGANGQFTVTALTEAPANDDTFVIV